MNYRGATGDDGEQAYLNDAYIRLVFAAGGLPVPIPPVEGFDDDVAAACRGEGLLLTGGWDLDPALYGQARHPKSTPLHARRQQAELAWFDWADRTGLPVMGICLGCQLINVARSGTLIQYLPERPGLLDHGRDGKYAFHDVDLCGDGLRSIVGEPTCPTNSRHVQAVEQVGRDLRAAARTADGVVEAVEDTTGRFVLGVQWHPEDIADRPATVAIMAAFLARAASGRAGQ